MALAFGSFLLLIPSLGDELEILKHFMANNCTMTYQEPLVETSAMTLKGLKKWSLQQGSCYVMNTLVFNTYSYTAQFSLYK
jgi:hypothetical protein